MGQLGANLERTWANLGQLEAHLGSFWSQLGAPEAKSDCIFTVFFKVFVKIEFSPPRAAQEAPREVQEALKMGQLRPNLGQLRANLGQLGANLGQLGANLCPTWANLGATCFVRNHLSKELSSPTQPRTNKARGLSGRFGGRQPHWRSGH